MSKKQGTPYEHVVAQVLRVMDPGASVSQGLWIEGPDGRRDLDVLIQGTIDGHARFILVECKDFNPKLTGPVGISYVDALESKQRDLKVHFAVLCSNSGFTKGAVSKASRMGIGLIGVMRKGDKRIRFSIMEELYTRRLKVEELTISLDGPTPIDLRGVNFEEIEYDGIPVGNWVIQHAILLIGSNPIVHGKYTVTHSLLEPVEFALPSGPVKVTQLNYNLRINGGWYAQQVSLDATQGMYDWLRHRVRLAPGPGQFVIQGIDIYAGDLINRPPNRELQGFNDILPGEFVYKLLLVSGLEPRDKVPALDKYIRPEDLEPIIPNLPAKAYTSFGTQ